MKFAEIKAMPKRMWVSKLREVMEGTTGLHESLFRSYHLLQKVKELLRAGVPAELLLEIIEDLEEDEQSVSGIFSSTTSTITNPYTEGLDKLRR